MIERPAVDRIEAFLNARFRIAASLILILAVTNCFWQLGQAPVVDWDEARHGITAHEMLLHADWIVSTYLNRPDYWNLKPPLGHWMTAASFWLFGPSAFALRFMSAVSAGFTVYLVMRLTNERHGGLEALLAGLILATTHGFVLEHAARSGHFDAALTLLSTATVLFLCRSERQPACLGLVGGLLSLAFLLKSFASLALVAVCGIFMLQRRRYRRVARWAYVLCFVGLVIPTLAWAVARYRQDGMIFLSAMAGYDLLRRSSQALEGNSGGYLYYLRELRAELGCWLPAMVVVAGANLIKRFPQPLSGEQWVPRHPTGVFWIWALAPLTLFSLARTKLQWYINLIYPPVAILLAVYTVGAVRKLPARVWWQAIGGAFVLAAMLGVASVNERSLLRDLSAQAGIEDAAQTFILRLPEELRGSTLFFAAEPRQAMLFAATALKGLQVDVLPGPVFEALLKRMPVTDLVAIELVTRKHLARGKARLLRVGASGDLILLAAGGDSEAFVSEHRLQKVAQSRDWLLARLRTSP